MNGQIANLFTAHSLAFLFTIHKSGPILISRTLLRLFEILFSSLGNAVNGTLRSTSLYEDKFRDENEHISEICGQLFFYRK